MKFVVSKGHCAEVIWKSAIQYQNPRALIRNIRVLFKVHIWYLSNFQKAARSPWSNQFQIKSVVSCRLSLVRYVGLGWFGGYQDYIAFRRIEVSSSRSNVKFFTVTGLIHAKPRGSELPSSKGPPFSPTTSFRPILARELSSTWVVWPQSMGGLCFSHNFFFRMHAIIYSSRMSLSRIWMII